MRDPLGQFCLPARPFDPGETFDGTDIAGEEQTRASGTAALFLSRAHRETAHAPEALGPSSKENSKPGLVWPFKEDNKDAGLLDLAEAERGEMRRGGRRVGRSRPKVVRLSTSFESVEEESYNERTARGLRTNALCPTRGSLICEQSVDPSERLLGQPGCSRGREAARLVGTPEEGI